MESWIKWSSCLMGQSLSLITKPAGRRAAMKLKAKPKEAGGITNASSSFIGSSFMGLGKWRMKTGTIDFLKSDDRGRYRREVFEISDEEVANLRKLIADVSKQILSLSFWDKTCDDSDCEWCRLSQTLQTKDDR